MILSPKKIFTILQLLIFNVNIFCFNSTEDTNSQEIAIESLFSPDKIYGILTSPNTMIAPKNRYWTLGKTISIQNKKRFIININNQENDLLITFNKPLKNLHKDTLDILNNLISPGDTSLNHIHRQLVVSLDIPKDYSKTCHSRKLLTITEKLKSKIRNYNQHQQNTVLTLQNKPAIKLPKKEIKSILKSNTTTHQQAEEEERETIVQRKPIFKPTTGAPEDKTTRSKKEKLVKMAEAIEELDKQLLILTRETSEWDKNVQHTVDLKVKELKGESEEELSESNKQIIDQLIHNICNQSSSPYKILKETRIKRDQLVIKYENLILKNEMFIDQGTKEKSKKTPTSKQITWATNVITEVHEYEIPEGNKLIRSTKAYNQENSIFNTKERLTKKLNTYRDKINQYKNECISLDEEIKKNMNELDTMKKNPDKKNDILSPLVIDILTLAIELKRHIVDKHNKLIKKCDLITGQINELAKQFFGE